MTSKSFTREQLIAALRKHHANFTLAARSLGISRADFVGLVEAYPEVKTLQDDASRELIDLALANVMNGLRKGDPDLSRWVLEHRHPRYRKDAKPESGPETETKTPEDLAWSSIANRVLVEEIKRRAEKGLPQLFTGPEFDKEVESFRNYQSSHPSS